MAQRAYDRNSLAVSPAGGLRLTPEIVKERIIHGQKMARLTEKVIQESADQKLSPGAAQSAALAAREQYALEHHIEGTQRDDYMTIAKKFADVDVDEMCQIPWEVLRNLRMKYVSPDYAKKLMKLFLHGISHPGCANALPATTEIVKIYMRQEDHRIRDVDNRLAGLTQELLKSPEKEIDENFRRKEANILSFIQERSSVMTPATPSIELPIGDTFVETLRSIFAEQPQTDLTPVLSAVRNIGPELQQIYESLLQTTLRSIEEKNKTHLSEIETVVQQLLTAKDERIATLQQTIDVYEKTIVEYDLRMESMAQEVDAVAQEKNKYQAEAIQQRHQKEEYRDEAIEYSHRLEVAENQRSLLEEQVSMLNSHVSTLQLTQQTIPALLRTYQEQIIELRTINGRLQNELNHQPDSLEELRKIKEENSQLKNQLKKIKESIDN